MQLSSWFDHSHYVAFLHYALTRSLSPSANGFNWISQAISLPHTEFRSITTRIDRNWIKNGTMAIIRLLCVSQTLDTVSFNIRLFHWTRLIYEGSGSNKRLLSLQNVALSNLRVTIKSCRNVSVESSHFFIVSISAQQYRWTAWQNVLSQQETIKRKVMALFCMHLIAIANCYDLLRNKFSRLLCVCAPHFRSIGQTPSHWHFQ